MYEIEQVPEELAEKWKKQGKGPYRWGCILWVVCESGLLSAKWIGTGFLLGAGAMLAWRLLGP